MITEIEKIWFEKLTQKKRKDSETFNDPDYEVWEDIVEKYSESAHFIYELIQNADDTKATEIKFILQKDKLFFIHNGTRQFSISDTETREEDKKNGKLGDINAITNIGVGTKKIDNNTMGKFGYGFKSVFTCTDTPEIYDDKFHFKIENYIVPILINNDFPNRKKGETLFILPFNRKDKSKEESYNEIKQKLQNLIFPSLFVNNIKNISYEFENVKSKYFKKINYTKQINKYNIQLDNISLEHNKETNNLLIFSRNINSLKYSVGFFIDANNKLIPSKIKSAFCYFPVIKENTGLNFIIHAPFVLTKSRETIKDINSSNGKENKDLILKLAELTNDSLLYLKDIKLIDENIFDIIPICKDNIFDNFKYFYDKILELFKNEEIIPTKSNIYSKKENVLWENDSFESFFSTKQIQELYKNNNIQYLKYNKTVKNSDEDIKYYLNKEIGIRYIYDKNILEQINETFIEKQIIPWLYKFYNWINLNQERVELIKKKPIFLNQDKKAVSMFKNNGDLNLFLSTDNVSNKEGYNYILPDLLKDKNTEKFIMDLGIKEISDSDIITSLIDEIGVSLQPKEEKINTLLKKIYKYWRDDKDKESLYEIIDRLEDKKFIFYKNQKGENGIDKISNLYYPTKELKEWFSIKQTTKFIDTDKYITLLGKNTKEDMLNMFFKDISIGVNFKIKTLKTYYKYDGFSNPIKNYPNAKRYIEIGYDEQIWKPIQEDKKSSCYYGSRVEYTFDGLEENIKSVKDKIDKNLSILIWKTLLEYKDIILYTEIEYFHYTTKCKKLLKIPKYIQECKWLFDKNNKLVSPNEITSNELADEYDPNSQESQKLIELLEIKQKSMINIDILPNETKKALELGQKLLEKGLTVNDMEEFLKMKQKQQNRLLNREKYHNISNNNNDNLRQNNYNQNNSITTPLNEDDSDEDEYNPKTVNYGEEIYKKQQQLAEQEKEIEKNEEIKTIQEEIENIEKYSYDWFLKLLDLEIKESDTKKNKNQDISIFFSKIEKIEGTERNFILKMANKYIPLEIETNNDIPLEITFKDKSKKEYIIDACSVKNYTLEIRLKSNPILKDEDIDKISNCNLKIEEPVFLLSKLYNRLSDLGKINNYSNNFNMRDNLCENIEFIFGPPGTGKTTYLATETIIPLIKNNNYKILVLTPTNKATDVLTKKIIEQCEKNKDKSYKQWLIRFGSTIDNTVDSVYKDKNFNVKYLNKYVVATTIDRYSYDKFIINGELNQLNWDYIIVDEASMIPLVKMIFPLYNQKSTKFVIAGDPFQIEPVIKEELWKGENIYTMVELNNFVENPKLVPHNYKVKLLTTQYRSVPTIGEIFNKFTYNGILKHNRRDNDIKICHIKDNRFNIKPLNILKFPMTPFESVYKSKKINKSSYQAYISIFVYEFIVWFCSLLSSKNEEWTIGIICVYRAEADVLEKLIESKKDIAKNIKIFIGTIHGFQGDECDFIFTIFTPSYIPQSMANDENFCNKQNIINVAISRAKNYLFIIMPDDNTKNINNLVKLKQIEELIKEDNNSFTEYNTNEIEKIIFDNDKYIEENSFSTGHQNVNVYGLPEKHYEIRADDSAVDIQIYDKNK